MERIWLGVLYLSGWHISSCFLRQYHYVADPKTWTEAQAYCREKYTDLATIQNSTEMDQLADTVSSSGHNSDVWIGLYSVVDWRWSDGYNGSGAEYRNWQNRIDNEPDFYSFHQFCVNIGSAGGWWDDSCSISYPFICYRGTQLEPQFVLVPNGKNWSDAQRHCRENFIDLATVRSGTENQEIHSLVPSDAWVWIGLSRDPNMYWSDGSGYTYSFLSTGSINISSTSVICGTAQQKSGKLRHCESRFPFVCYSVPPPHEWFTVLQWKRGHYIRISAPLMRQVVKLRIEPDAPSVDMNDPAVKANILKKLQDRLKEKGMSGVTLKWREQPDGKVFHKEKKSSRKKTEL
ncbi:secretory phospholipase A2 receptor-like isoform X1 [Epinephelus fuscoguttatus]|uniref:secretory phospholipase A2 receptor-like isoform X1 n=1 Tax=Epinephelus fuscoguttatus TaxID=293821 RepID=UPI0020D0B8C8|nr:secretory phospholipase A2 receptor-like isoform X1 [Epinephelus fuscoguttatus]